METAMEVMPQHSTLTLPILGDVHNEVVMHRLRSNASRLVPVADIIARVSESHVNTVGSWLVNPGAKSLGGLTIIKLWHLLPLLDVESPEMDKVEDAYPLGFFIGKLIAFGLMTSDEACKLLKVQIGGVLSGVRGAPNVRLKEVEKRKTLESLKRKYGGALAKKMADIRAEASQLLPKERVTDPAVESMVESLHQTSDDRPGNTASSEHEIYNLLRYLAGSISTAHSSIMLATSVLDDNQLELLRKMVGSNNVFELINELRKLSSLRNRDKINKGE